MAEFCGKIAGDEILSWLDGDRSQLSSPEVEQHLAGCSKCQQAAMAHTAYRDRMSQLSQSGAQTFSSQQRQKLIAGLDNIDAERKSQKKRILRRNPLIWIPATALLLVAIVWASGLLSPVHNVPVRQLIIASPVDFSKSMPEELATSDADKAAGWLSDKLGAYIPTMNLNAQGAVFVQARADTDKGLMTYRTGSGASLYLHIYNMKTELPRMSNRQYEGNTYQVMETEEGSAVSWKSDGTTYVAASALPLDKLLPFAHEMGRQCIVR